MTAFVVWVSGTASGPAAATWAGSCIKERERGERKLFPLDTKTKIMPSHSPFPFPANAIVPLALISPLNETRCGRNRFRVVDVEENKKKKMRLLRVVLCAYNASIARVCVLWILHLRLAERTTTTGSYARLTQFSCCNECNPRFYRGASRNRASKLLSHDGRYSLLTWSIWFCCCCCLTMRKSVNPV